MGERTMSGSLGSWSLFELWEEGRVSGQKGSDKAMFEHFQRINDAPRLLPWHRLVEGKRAGVLYVHLHITLGRSLAVGESRDYCIVYGPSFVENPMRDRRASAQGHVPPGVARNRRHDMQRPVLVGVPQILKPQKRPISLFPKGLYPANRCPYRGMDTAQLIATSVRREPGRVLAA